jgi:hypothetical protein
MNKYDVKLPVLKLSNEELLSNLKEVSEKVGKSAISRKDFDKYSKYSYTSYRNHFGSFKKALAKLNLSRTRNWGTSEEEYLENIKDIWVLTGGQPKYKDMDIPESKHSSVSYRHYFGSWTNALKKFTSFIDKEVICNNETLKLKKEIAERHKTSRNINWRLRFIVMKRDNFKCKICGRSPGKDNNVILHVDHKIAWTNGGETVLENLETLCSICNIGKSNKE